VVDGTKGRKSLIKKRKRVPRKEKAMDRDRQIELLADANERATRRVAAWLTDPKVKEALKRNHETTRAAKRKPKRACS
jgi:hypothetical protein